MELTKKSTRSQPKLKVFRSLEDSYNFNDDSLVEKDKKHKDEHFHGVFDVNVNSDKLHTSAKYASNGHLSASYSKLVGSEMQENNFSEIEADTAGEELVQPFSPPLLMELTSFPEAYDDLLAPMSEGDAALMECSMQTMHA